MARAVAISNVKNKHSKDLYLRLSRALGVHVAVVDDVDTMDEESRKISDLDSRLM
jgi:hypothetical protein